MSWDNGSEIQRVDRAPDDGAGSSGRAASSSRAWTAAAARRATPSTNMNSLSANTVILLDSLQLRPSLCRAHAPFHPLTQFFVLPLLPRRVQRPEFRLQFLTPNSTSRPTFFAPSLSVHRSLFSPSPTTLPETD